MKRLLVLAMLIWATSFSQTWQSLNVPTAVDIEYHPDSSNVMLIAGMFGGVFKSYDGGESFDTLIFGITPIDITFHPTLPNIFFIACGPGLGNNPGILKAIQTDEGYEYIWSDSGINLNSETTVRRVGFLPGTLDTMFATTARSFDGDLYRSNNGGRSWTIVDVPIVGQLYFLEMDPNNVDVLYYGPSADVIYKSFDAGDSWTEINYGGTSYPYANALDINPLNSSTVYLTDRNEGLFKSTDEGATWISIGSDLPITSFHNLVIDPADTSKIYLVGYSGVFCSNDAGLSWIDYTYNMTGFTNQFQGLWLGPDSRYLYATTNLSDFYRLDLTTVSIEEIKTLGPTDFNLRVFPNPTNSQIKIIINSMTVQNNVIEVWDMTGKLVKRMNIELNIGTNMLVWNGNNHKSMPCDSGVYIITISSEFSQLSQKFILLK